MSYQKLDLTESRPSLSRYALYKNLKKSLRKELRGELKAHSFGVIEPDSLKDFDSGMMTIKLVKLVAAVQIAVFAILAILSIPMGSNALALASISMVGAGVTVYALAEAVKYPYMNKELSSAQQQEVIDELVENIDKDMFRYKEDYERYEELECHKKALLNFQVENLKELNREEALDKIKTISNVNFQEHDSKERSYLLVAIGVTAFVAAVLVVLSLLQFTSLTDCSITVSGTELLKAVLIRSSIGVALTIVAAKCVVLGSSQLDERKEKMNERQAQYTLDELREEVERKRTGVKRGKRRYNVLNQIQQVLIETHGGRKRDDSLVSQDDTTFCPFQRREDNPLMTQIIYLDEE